MPGCRAFLLIKIIPRVGFMFSSKLTVVGLSVLCAASIVQAESTLQRKIGVALDKETGAPFQFKKNKTGPLAAEIRHDIRVEKKDIHAQSAQSRFSLPSFALLYQSCVNMFSSKKLEQPVKDVTASAANKKQARRIGKAVEGNQEALFKVQGDKKPGVLTMEIKKEIRAENRAREEEIREIESRWNAAQEVKPWFVLPSFASMRSSFSTFFSKTENPVHVEKSVKEKKHERKIGKIVAATMAEQNNFESKKRQLNAQAHVAAANRNAAEAEKARQHAHQVRMSMSKEDNVKWDAMAQKSCGSSDSIFEFGFTKKQAVAHKRRAFFKAQHQAHLEQMAQVKAEAKANNRGCHFPLEF